MQTILMRQYARNAAGLQTMLDKAERTEKKVGGYTADELRGMVATYRRLAETGDVPPVPSRAS